MELNNELNNLYKVYVVGFSSIIESSSYWQFDTTLRVYDIGDDEGNHSIFNTIQRIW